MSDHVRKALDKALEHWNEGGLSPSMERFTRLAVRCGIRDFINEIIELGPDEEMIEADAYQDGETLMYHLATRLEAIAQKEKG